MIREVINVRFVGAVIIFGALMCGSVSAAMLSNNESKETEKKEQSCKSGQAVFVICGTSGAGKSLKCSEIMWWLYKKGITQDDIICRPVDGLTETIIKKCNQLRGKEKKTYGKLRYITQENFALALEIKNQFLAGKSVLVDTVFGSDYYAKEEHAEFLSMLKGIPVCTIMLHCAPDILVKRTNNRPEHDRKLSNVFLQYSNNFDVSPTPVLQRTSPLFSTSDPEVISPIQGFVTSPRICRRQVDVALTSLEDPTVKDRFKDMYFAKFVPIEPDKSKVEDDETQMFIQPIIETDLFISNDTQSNEADSDIVLLIVNLIEKRIGKAKGFSIGTSPSSCDQ